MPICASRAQFAPIPRTARQFEPRSYPGLTAVDPADCRRSTAPPRSPAGIRAPPPPPGSPRPQHARQRTAGQSRSPLRNSLLPPVCPPVQRNLEVRLDPLRIAADVSVKPPAIAVCHQELGPPHHDHILARLRWLAALLPAHAKYSRTRTANASSPRSAV